MKSFNPINKQEETEYEIEEHIREVELENAVKLYQEALQAHHGGNLDAAAAVYEQLIQSSILHDASKAPALTRRDNRHSSASKLPALVYRNHATLLLQRLGQQPHATPKHARAVLQAVLASYATALTFDPEDTLLWRRTLEIGETLKLTRVQRTALESLLRSSAVAELATRGLFWHDAPDPFADKVREKLEILVDAVHGGRPLSAIEADGNEPPGAVVLAQNEDPAPHPLEAEIVRLHLKQATAHAMANLLLQHYAEVDSSRLSHVKLYTIVLSQDEGADADGFAQEMEEPLALEVGRINSDPFGEAVEQDEQIDQSHEHRSPTPAARQLAMLEPATVPRIVEEASAPSRSPSSSPSTSSKRPREEDAAEAQDIPPSPKRTKLSMNLTAETGQLFFTEWLRRLFDPIGVDFTAFLSLEAAPPEEHDEEESLTEDSINVFDDFKRFLYLDWSDAIYEASTELTMTAKGESFATSMMLSFPEVRRPEHCSVALPESLLALLNQEPLTLRAWGLAWQRALCGTGTSSYLLDTWSADLLLAVRRLLAVDEMLLLLHVKQIRESFEREESSQADLLETAYLSQAVFELHIDELAETRRDALGDETLQDVADASYESVQRWHAQVRSLLHLLPSQASDLQCRCEWASVLMRQFSGATPEDLIEDFNQLRSLIGESCIVLPNLATMQRVDAETLDFELQKFKTMGFFDQVFTFHAADDHQSIRSQLEPILLPTEGLSGKDLLVFQYLEHAPADFRLQLWRWLADACFAQGDEASGLFVSLCSLEQLNQSLLGPEYFSLSNHARQQIVLHVLHHSGKAVSRAAHLIDSHKIDTLTDKQCIRCMQALTTFGTLCMVAAFYDDHLAENESATRASDAWLAFRSLLRQQFVEFWVIMYRLFARALQARDVVDSGAQLGALLSTLHEELGTRKYCSLADGLLLGLLEDEIYHLNRVEMENDLVQVFHCRYDLGFVVGTFWPWEHSAVPIDLSMENAIRMTPFLLTMVTERTPGLWLPKNDLRSVLQKVHDKVWPPLKVDEIRIRNEAILDTFLESEIVPKEFAQCLSGGVLLPFKQVTPPSGISDESWAGYRDLNLVLGRIHLSLYKTRNKQAPGKGLDDLDTARQYYTCDLTLEPGRIESWRSLAFAYGALADYELSLDAERIAANKEHICELRRSNLFCSMLALSTAIQQSRRGEQENGLTEVSFCDLLHEFGMQIYSAARDPFGMAVFERQTSRYLLRGSESPREEHVPGVTLQLALRVACKCLSRASRSCSVKWSCLLLLGKAHAKLKLAPSVALDNFVQAIQAAPERNSSSFYGPLIEPDYKLISCVCKYLQGGQITPATAIDYLTKSTFSQGLLPDSSHPLEKDVLESIAQMLQALRGADKKQWHHRPVHRQVQLLLAGIGSYDLEEGIKRTPARQAQACLENLFTVKGSGSNLLSIWRPETERPGRHFVYGQRYTTLYFDLLVQQGDIEGIKNFMRRARKAMSNMMDHKSIWERMCKQYISMMLELHEIETGLQDDFLDLLMSDVFAPAAKRLEHVVALPDFVQPSLFVMRELYDLRKLNGGLYETCEVDDVIIDCYISLYQFVEDMTDAELGIEAEEPIAPALTDSSAVAAPSSPSASTIRRQKAKDHKIVKITRKDVLNRAFTLCKPPAPVAELRKRAERGASRAAEAEEKGTEVEVVESSASDAAAMVEDSSSANPQAPVDVPAHDAEAEAIMLD